MAVLPENFSVCENAHSYVQRRPSNLIFCGSDTQGFRTPRAFPGRKHHVRLRSFLQDKIDCHYGAENQFAYRMSSRHITIDFEHIVVGTCEHLFADASPLLSDLR